MCAGRRRRKGGVHPDDAFYASVRLHAIAPRHIRVSPYPDGDRCKATPLISTSASSFGLKRSKISGTFAARFLFRTLPRSPFRSFIGHQNRDALLLSAIPSLCSLRVPLSPPVRHKIYYYQIKCFFVCLSASHFTSLVVKELLSTCYTLRQLYNAVGLYIEFKIKCCP